MRLTVTTLSDDIFTLEVSDDMELENLKALCEVETGMPARELVIFHNGRPLPNNTKALKDVGIRDGDMILLQRIQGVMGQSSLSNLGALGSNAARGSNAPQIDFSQIQIPGASRAGAPAAPSNSSSVGGDNPDPATLREILLSSPHDLAMLRERNPPLAEALVSGNLERFTEVLRQQQRERVEKERERIRLLTADPFDSDAQSRIAEEIRLRNVEHNMETAMEHSPENFGQVTMLYIDCNVNGHPVKAFVDSGAQMTIMSQSCAERCNIMRLVDTRWAGVAKGVGTQRIIGRVHLCQIQIGTVYLQSSFSILEDQPMDMLLGLDMLKRHQCTLDLQAGVLKIGTSPGVQTPFLSEADLPEHARLNRPISDSDVAMDEDRQLAEALAKSQADAGPGSSHHQRNNNSNNNASGSQSSAPPPVAVAPLPAAVAPPPSALASNPVPSPQVADTFPEAAVARLVGFGFARQLVIEELRLSNGDADQALAALFAKSFQVP